MSLDQWPAAFKAAGLSVQLHNGFPNTSKPQGSLNSPLMSLYVHHDATPAGPTPGALNWIIDSYNAGSPSAQLWLDTSGVWHFCGAGVASHAGVVRGPLTSKNSVGVETDHTVNELYPAPMMASLLKGCAVACKVEKRQADFITFHKIEATPRGRKVDPWLSQASNTLANWDKELADFRAKVQILISTGGEVPSTPSTPSEGDWLDMVSPAELDAIFDKKFQQYAAHFGRESVKALINQQTDVNGKPEYYPFGDTAKVQIADTVWSKMVAGASGSFQAQSYLANITSRAELNEVARWIVDQVENSDVVIYEDAGGLWWSEGGQSYGIPDPQTLDGMKMVAAQMGKKILEWPGGDVDLPGAFGARNGVIPAAEAPAPAKTYTVVAGDTFTGIAKKLGVSVDALKAANPQVTDINNIAVGQVLNVPKA